MGDGCRFHVSLPGCNVWSESRNNNFQETTPPKMNVIMESNHLKMYFLVKNGDFPLTC